MAEIQLNFHPEAKAFMEAVLSKGFDSKEPLSIGKQRRTNDEICKIGGIGTVKDYQGTRTEFFVDSKDVEGKMHTFSSILWVYIAIYYVMGNLEDILGLKD